MYYLSVKTSSRANDNRTANSSRGGIRAQSTWDKGPCFGEGEPHWPADVKCLFGPLWPAGHTKAQKGYIDSALQGGGGAAKRELDGWVEGIFVNSPGRIMQHTQSKTLPPGSLQPSHPQTLSVGVVSGQGRDR